ncbi:MAG: hypothetical protein JWO31_4087, partial [Phycisphaerales bacterium]|nr:hypothetical protein [Phycisphaerales bacterium]
QATDDGDQALCLIRSYVDRGRFDPADVGGKLVGWLDGNPPDVGGTTRRTLGRLRSGVPWHDAAYADFQRNPGNAANGSLMRNGVLPGICFGQELDLLFRATVQHSIVTHYAPLPVLCCAVQSWVIADLLGGWGQGPADDPGGWLDHFYADWNSYLEDEDDPHVRQWVDRTRGHFQAAGEAIEAAAWTRDAFDPFRTDFAGRAGYCLLTLQVGVWALLWSLTKDQFPIPKGFPADAFARRGAWCLAWPALVGHDSDTTGATAGPMVAAAHGAVPVELAERLEAVAAFDMLVPSAGKR